MVWPNCFLPMLVRQLEQLALGIDDDAVALIREQIGYSTLTDLPPPAGANVAR